jgi:hypothetical protein
MASRLSWPQKVRVFFEAPQMTQLPVAGASVARSQRRQRSANES